MNPDSSLSLPGENTAKPGRARAPSRAGSGRRGGMTQPEGNRGSRFGLWMQHRFGGALAVFVGSGIVLISGLLFCFGVAKPFFQCLVARNWTPTPCVVLSSRVVKGKAFHVEMLYAYEFNGQQYESSRYHFYESGSPHSSGQKAIVARYPRGQKAVCYVNPKDPAAAVLGRRLSWEMLRAGLFMLAGVVAGTGAICFGICQVRAKRVDSRIGFFLGSLVFAACWTLSASHIIWEAIIPKWRQSGRVPLPWWKSDTMEMVLFVWVGLVSIGVFLVALVGLFRSRHKGGRKRAVSKAPNPATAGVAVPYGVDQRPMPTGDDLDRLLPRQVGGFTRTELRRPADLYLDPIYAQYRKDNAEVFVELGICSDARGAQEALATAKAETDAEPDQVIQRCSEGTEPSFLKTVSPTLGAFLAWTRGAYYFSAHAKEGESDLDSFVRDFPY
jgi:hypothetical protein